MEVVAAPLPQRVPRALGQLLSMPVRVTNFAAVAVFLALMEQMRQAGRYRRAHTPRADVYKTDRGRPLQLGPSLRQESCEALALPRAAR